MSASARVLAPSMRVGVLRGRGVARVSGAAARSFLQGLVTAGLRSHNGSGTELRYTHFLNGRGRVEFEAFLHCRGGKDGADGGVFDIDVEKHEVGRLCRHLKLYALRANVAIDDVSADMGVVAAVGGASGVGDAGGETASGLPILLRGDPRLPGLGLRGVATRVDTDAMSVVGDSVEEMDTELARVATVLGVPGGGDFSGAGRLPLEMGLHRLNGVSFNKGCYLGQELTARTFHTGTLRKHVVPFAVGIGGRGCSDERRKEFADLVRKYRELACRSGEPALDFAEAVLSCCSSIDGVVKVGEQLLVPGKKRAVGVVTSVLEGGTVGLAVVRVDDAFPEVSPPRAQDIGHWMQVEGSGIHVLPWLPAYFNG